MNPNVAATHIRRRQRAEIHAIVRAELESIVHGHSTLPAVNHPLGFACFPLVRGDQPRGVCLHVWEPGRRAVQLETSPYHCHSWHLLSHILFGAVGNQMVTTRPGTTFQAVTVRSDASGDTMIPTRNHVDIELHEPKFWAAGDYYTLPAGHFHASVRTADRRPTATLVVGTRDGRHSDITLADPYFTACRIDRLRFSTADTQDIARSVLAHLKAATASTHEPALAR